MGSQFIILLILEALAEGFHVDTEVADLLTLHYGGYGSLPGLTGVHKA